MANGGAVAPARRGLAAHVGAARGLALLLLDLLRTFVTFTAVNHQSETKLPDPDGLNMRRWFRSPTATRLWNSFLCHSLSSTVLSTQCAAFSFACAAGSGSERFALLRVFSQWVPALALPPRGSSPRPGDLRRHVLVHRPLRLIHPKLSSLGAQSGALGSRKISSLQRARTPRSRRPEL